MKYYADCQRHKVFIAVTVLVLLPRVSSKQTRNLPLLGQLPREKSRRTMSVRSARMSCWESICLSPSASRLLYRQRWNTITCYFYLDLVAEIAYTSSVWVCGPTIRDLPILRTHTLNVQCAEKILVRIPFCRKNSSLLSVRVWSTEGKSI
jgi:hypothetical protein